MADITNWSFLVYDDDDLPPAFARKWELDGVFPRLIAPLFLVLSGPFCSRCGFGGDVPYGRPGRSGAFG